MQLCETVNRHNLRNDRDTPVGAAWNGQGKKKKPIRRLGAWKRQRFRRHLSAFVFYSDISWEASSYHDPMLRRKRRDWICVSFSPFSCLRWKKRFSNLDQITTSMATTSKPLAFQRKGMAGKNAIIVPPEADRFAIGFAPRSLTFCNWRLRRSTLHHRSTKHRIDASNRLNLFSRVSHLPDRKHTYWIDPLDLRRRCFSSRLSTHGTCSG